MTITNALLPELKQQLLALETDLRARLQLPQFGDAWRHEYQQAFAAERTGQTWRQWSDDRINQAAVSWLLTTVFIRFCEDNRLLGPVWIANPDEQRRQEALDAQLGYFRAHPEHSDREWLEQAINYLAVTPATAALVGPQAMLHTISPSGNAVTALLDFWRERDSAGQLRHDFTDPGLDTRFLGDLYQDLSEHAKKTYALLQTPEFVEEFILDRTLEPALNERPLEGFRMIDPACGSGHFLTGAFRRLLERWDAEAPGLGPRERVQKALDAVWGVDINPFAVVIATFRLTVAALQAVNAKTLDADNVGFDYHVLAGDSLWFGRRRQELLDEPSTQFYAYPTEQKVALLNALAPRQYDAVVANPPYITVKDKALNEAYREDYSYLRGTYSMTAPFMELLFRIAKQHQPGQAPGWVGQITSNSFMKREFGKPLIEKFLPTVDLIEVVDTSGAYIPGHGTPTLILVGRHCARKLSTVRTVLGIQGEPGRPEIPANGFVWSSIRDHIDHEHYQDQWITVTAVQSQALAVHPWSLTGGGAAELQELLPKASPETLSSKIAGKIGFASFPGADDAFFSPRESLIRVGVAESLIRQVIRGENVRDWGTQDGISAFVPYTAKQKLLQLDKGSLWYRRQWPLRTELGGTVSFNRLTRAELGDAWWAWYRWVAERYRIPLSITFAFVATHNHFVLDRGGKVFKQSAPVIKLPEGASEDDHLELLGVLNSSTACFWLKQNSHNKGNGGIGGGIGDESWEPRYEFTGTTLKDFPLPASLPLERARTLDKLAQELAAQQVSVLIAEQTPTPELLQAAEASQAYLRSKMIAQQEELDWQVYQLYGLFDGALVLNHEPPEIQLGERAFEIVLARKIAAGEEETTWFERHGSTPITEIPERWPADYRELVQRRIDAIESDQAIGLLEAPEFKRRWASETFASQQEKALRTWLLDRVEARELWLNRHGQPTPQSIAQLADVLGRDESFRSVLELWQGHRDLRMVPALTELLTTEAVPYLAAHRLKDSGLRKFAEWQRTWQLQRLEDRGEQVGKIAVPPKYTTADFRKQHYWSARGKLDVPKERFIEYPDAGRETDPTMLLGWAGWDHAQQSLALATIIQQREQEGADPAVLTPLVAGLAEVQPWVEMWHADIDPNYGISPADFGAEQLRAQLHKLELTHEDLAGWRPPSRTRGRKARS